MEDQLKNTNIIGARKKANVCPYDAKQLMLYKVLPVTHKGLTVNVHVLRCPICNRKYVTDKVFDGKRSVSINKETFINLNMIKQRTAPSNIPHNPSNNNVVPSKSPQSKKERLGYVTTDTISSLTTCYKSGCKGKLKSIKLRITKQNGKLPDIPAKKCSECGRYYIPVQAYIAYPNLITCLNLSVYNSYKQHVKEHYSTGKNKGTIEKKAPAKSPEPVATVSVSGQTDNGYLVYDKLRKIKTCRDQSCGGVLANVMICSNIFVGKPKKYSVKRCTKCGKYYVPVQVYESNKDLINFLNEDSYHPSKEKQLELERKNRLMQERQKKILAKPALESSKLQPYSISKQAMNGYLKIEKEAVKQKSGANGNTIGIKDFLIRKNIFHCAHSDHVIKDITATVSVINRSGKIEKVKVAAGYCNTCNVFFIMEPMFNHIMNRGTPLCRVYEWSKIENPSSEGTMDLAQQSLLRQYGYTVNATTNLSQLQRIHILEILVDSGIMTKSEIISYLSFFISQRKNNKNMQNAVAKWESDKEYISNYKIGSSANYQIRALI